MPFRSVSVPAKAQMPFLLFTPASRVQKQLKRQLIMLDAFKKTNQNKTKQPRGAFAAYYLDLQIYMLCLWKWSVLYPLPLPLLRVNHFEKGARSRNRMDRKKSLSSGLQFRLPLYIPSFLLSYKNWDKTLEIFDL